MKHTSKNIFMLFITIGAVAPLSSQTNTVGRAAVVPNARPVRHSLKMNAVPQRHKIQIDGSKLADLREFTN